MWGGIGTNLRIFFIAATLSCISQFSFGQFFIGGKKCISVTPPIPPDPLPQGWQPPSVDCNEPTVFFDTKKDATAWQWDFGDPTSGNNTATTRNPRHTYTVPRTYTVTLTRTLASGVVETDTKDVTISEPPPQPKFFKKISADTTVCDGKTLKLDPYNVLQGGASAPSDVSYLWFPGGETTPTIDVTKTGCYSVEVFDALGQCSRTAKINVKFCLQEASSSGGGEKWYFGKGATLSFGLDSTTILPRDTMANDGGLFEDPEQEDPKYKPVETTESNPVDSPAGVAMVYSPKGELVFYTDGDVVYGKDDQLLPYMLPLDDTDPLGHLGGTNTSVQSSLIIPKSSCNECPHHLYYVYTQNKDTGLLSYSIVDLRRDNGKGAVVERGIPVSINSTQQIVARKTQDEKGFFIYSHDAETNEFKVLKVDSTGTTETVQALGMIPSDTTGYMRLSPEGDKIALATVKNGKNYVEVFNLDPATGELSLALSINLKVDAPPMIYGVEFSQDGEKLYTSLKGDPTKGEKSFLYQLNLNLGDADAISDLKIKLDESTTQAFGALQMGPTNAGSGGSIYMAIDGSDKIAYISRPETVGNASEVGYIAVKDGFGAKVLGTSHLGFPNVIHSKEEQEGEGISATFDGTCLGSPTKFSTQGICSPMESKITWDFGDGTTGSGTEVSHTYEKEGKYYIKMTVEVFVENVISKNVNKIPIVKDIIGNALKENCYRRTVEDSVYIKPTPIVNLPDSAFVCVIEGAKIILDPKAQRTFAPTYRWITNETTPTIFADALGTYTVTVSNNYQSRNGVVSCPVKDETLVKEGCEPRLFAPEAFSPNGDSINDNFEIHSAHIEDFDLKIYNRWGEIIFESFAVDMRWDGKYKGKIMAPMMYAFVVSYKSKYFPYRPKITKTGGVMLIN